MRPRTTRISRSRPRILVVLGKVVEDLIPRSLRPDEHMRSGPERWLVNERAIRHTDLAFVARPIEQREALPAAPRMVAMDIADQYQRVGALAHPQLLGLDFAPGQERRACHR